MPYRDQATVTGWLDEFIAARQDVEAQVSVLEQDFTPGPESGLVVVSLRNASTVTYIQPVHRDGAPRWMVTFEARSESFELDAVGVAKLANDIGAIASICEFLQIKTDAAVIANRPLAEA